MTNVASGGWLSACVAPIRICDNGGWTDTWFAGHGKVFNIGVYPYVEVQIEVLPREAQEDRIVLFAENYGERFVVCLLYTSDAADDRPRV